MDSKKETKNEESLAVLLPQSTSAERRRFLAARDDDLEAAASMLGEYLNWIDLHNVQNPEADVKDVWECAFKKAISTRGDATETICPPQVIFSFLEHGKQYVTKNGEKIVQVMAARFDLTICDAETYALIMALYCQYLFSRDSMEKMILLVDVRAGEGWANPSPLSCMSLIKAARICNELFPERLKTMILFPVPTIATYIWAMVKPLLDPDTVGKIQVLAGSASRTCPPPVKLSEHIDSDTLEILETNRKRAQNL